MKKDDNQETDDVVYEEEATNSVSIKKKMDKLRAQLEDCRKEKQQALEDLQRAKADFINMRRRDELHAGEFKKYAKESVLLDVLPVIDSFDLAFSNTAAWEAVDKNWRAGVEYIYKQLVGILDQHGLKPFSPEGEMFDPSKSEAVATIAVDSPDQDHKIISVIQKGYSLGDRVVRPAKVNVGELKQ